MGTEIKLRREALNEGTNLFSSEGIYSNPLGIRQDPSRLVILQNMAWGIALYEESSR